MCDMYRFFLLLMNKNIVGGKHFVFTQFIFVWYKHFSDDLKHLSVKIKKQMKHVTGWHLLLYVFFLLITAIFKAKTCHRKAGRAVWLAGFISILMYAGF